MASLKGIIVASGLAVSGVGVGTALHQDTEAEALEELSLREHERRVLNEYHRAFKKLAKRAEDLQDPNRQAQGNSLEGKTYDTLNRDQVRELAQILMRNMFSTRFIPPTADFGEKIRKEVERQRVEASQEAKETYGALERLTKSLQIPTTLGTGQAVHEASNKLGGTLTSLVNLNKTSLDSAQKSVDDHYGEFKGKWMRHAKNPKPYLVSPAFNHKYEIIEPIYDRIMDLTKPSDIAWAAYKAARTKASQEFHSYFSPKVSKGQREALWHRFQDKLFYESATRKKPGGITKTILSDYRSTYFFRVRDDKIESLKILDPPSLKPRRRQVSSAYSGNLPTMKPVLRNNNPRRVKHR